MYKDQWTECFKRPDKEFYDKLELRLRNDYMSHCEQSQTLQASNYREQFSPTFLYCLDELVKIIEDKTLPCFEIRFYERNNFYMCVLTILEERIMIFIYRIDSQFKIENDVASLRNEATDPVSLYVTFYRIHDATDDVKRAMKKNWVSNREVFLSSDETQIKNII